MPLHFSLCNRVRLRKTKRKRQTERETERSGQKLPIRYNPNKLTSRNTITKFSKIKDKNNILKATKAAN